MLVLDLELRIVITMGYLISDQFKMHFMQRRRPHDYTLFRKYVWDTDIPH